MLVVMDAKTLKKTAAFTREELSELNWPSHVAVLDEQHIYIRDNAGVYRLDSTTGTLTFVEGSDGAPKSQFVTMNGKVYTYKSGLEISTESDAVNSISLPWSVTYDINEVLGIQKSDDGKIWIMTFGFGKPAIGKFDPTTKEIKQHLLGVKVSTGSSGVAFAARGNDIYYADNMTIYHLAFDDDKEDDTNEEGKRRRVDGRCIRPGQECRPPIQRTGSTSRNGPRLHQYTQVVRKLRTKPDLGL